MVPPAVVVAAATRSASDSNLRCRKEEWPACSSRRGSDLPHPILIFVAAKKNGSACSGRSSSDEVRIRFYSPLPRRRMVSPADRNFPTAASILDFGARLENRCRVFHGNAFQRASILDFEARLENRCSAFAAAAKNGPPAAQSWGAGRGARKSVV